MENIHKDEQGNILSYEDWKGEIITQQDMLEYILNIQTEQLSECRKRYNNTCYNALAAKIIEENNKVDLKTDAYTIFRGQQMSEFVHNYSRSTNINPLQDALDGMDDLLSFIYSYNHDFINECFSGHLVEHLQSKFNSYYVKGEPLIGITKFISNLDMENRKKLYAYILNKKTIKSL